MYKGMLPQNGEGGVIFCEPLLCNSYSLLVHVYLFSYGSLKHVKHMLQPLLLAQENNRSRVRFLQGAGLTNLWLALPFALAFALFRCFRTSFGRSFAVVPSSDRPCNHGVSSFGLAQGCN